MDEWYKSYYGQQYADSVREILVPSRTEGEVRFIKTVTALTPPAAVADVGCGEGRHALVLAREGFEVTAVDQNPSYIDEAKRAADPAHPLRFIVGDMRHAIEGPFDLVLSLFNSFGFFDDKENNRVLETWSAQLVAGGWFLLDLWNRDSIIRHFQSERTRHLAKGLEVTELSKFDALGGRLNKRYIYKYTDGSTYQYDTSFRVYAPSEVRQILESIGMFVESIYGSLHGDPYSYDAERLVILARRPC